MKESYAEIVESAVEGLEFPEGQFGAESIVEMALDAAERIARERLEINILLGILPASYKDDLKARLVKFVENLPSVDMRRLAWAILWEWKPLWEAKKEEKY